MRVNKLSPKVNHISNTQTFVTFECDNNSDMKFLKDLERHKHSGVVKAFKCLLEDIENDQKIRKALGEDKIVTLKTAVERLEINYSFLSKIFDTDSDEAVE